MASELAFCLPGQPFGGGVNSVVQEFASLVDNFGCGRLVVEDKHLEQFRRGYAWSVEALARLSSDPEDIPDGAAVVATTNDSLAHVLRTFGDRAARVYYYVQDFEPLFYARHSTEHGVAVASYAMAQEAVAVVKTRWLERMLLQHSFLPVVKIRPSIDRSVYRPVPHSADGRRRSFVAMLRPVTPRRGSARTVAVLNRLATSTSPSVDIEVFGADPTDLADAGLRLDRSISNHGRVNASRAGEILRRGDFFVDLSDYQAFGRSVAEGMAAGVVPIVTDAGAPPEFVTHRASGFLVDARDLEASLDACLQAAALSDDALASLRLSAMEAVSSWSVEATAADWFGLMRDA